MARCCCVPGCQVLLTSRLPMCTHHWGRVGQAERQIITCERMDADYIAAMQTAIDQAQKKTQNMGRTGSTYPSGPAIA